MYKPTKRLLTCSLAISLVAAGSFGVMADENKDSVDAGLSAKVETYIAEGGSEDPVSDLTKGAASVKDDSFEFRREVIPGMSRPSLIALEERKKGEERNKKNSPAEYPQFKNRAIATVTGKLNIREEADAESKLIGTLSRGDICMVYESKDGWTKIASGCCEGYVMTEYLAFGDDAGRWAKENDIPMLATVNVESLKVREGADYESACITMIPMNESYEVVSVDGDWVLLAVDYDVMGYVNKKYVDLSYNVGRALSVEEQEMIDASRAANDDAAGQDNGYTQEDQNTDNGNNDTYDNNDNYNNDTYDNNDNYNTGNNDNYNNDNYSNDTYNNDNYNSDTYDNNESNNNDTYDNNDTNDDYSNDSYEEPQEEPSYDLPSGEGGDAVAAYACQFIGNPYVWGGTSLTNGADCSGFVLSVYANWGIYLPHDAELQANYGTPVDFSQLMPGDLLFYASGGYDIGHVAIYIGGGQVVHASSPSTGIKISVYNYRTPCKAVRLLP